MELESLKEAETERVERHIVIRIIAAIFWLVITMLAVQIIVGGFVGGMAGAQIDASQSISDAYHAGSVAGEKAAADFMIEYGGIVFLFELALWLGLLISGKYPWVSKFKTAKK